MRIGNSFGIAAYQKDMTASNKTSENKNNKKNSSYDSLELSTEGVEALNSSRSEEKSYDLNKVLEIHKKGFSEIPSREESEYYWAARKSDPALDRALYEQDKAEALKFVGQVQMILMKVRSGQPLTAEEKEMVKNDPLLKQNIM